MKIETREQLIAKQKEYHDSLNSQRKQILICAGTGCVAGGSLEIYAKMKEIIEEKLLRKTVRYKYQIYTPVSVIREMVGISAD